MEIKQRSVGEVTVLDLTDRLDVLGADQLKEVVAKLLASGVTRIHLNLSGVDMIMSSGLGELVNILKALRPKHGRLTLSNLQAYVQEKFEITQISFIFEIYLTEEDALAAHLRQQ